MAGQFHKASWKSRGWMSFTVANLGVLHLGGVSQTAPTAHLSGGVSDATGFLATGIPQLPDKSEFADRIRKDDNGHSIKHVIVDIVSAGATTPAGRTMTDGSTPTTSLGAQVLAADSFTIENSTEQVFNFKLFNRSGSNMVVEVKVFE